MKADKHPHINKLEYDKITEHIYIGTNMCCQVHFENKLLKQNIRADISLEKERLDNPQGVNYFLWLPTKDGNAPTLNQLYVGVKAIKNLVERKVKMYVHCMNGHGRAPTLVAAYLILQGKNVGDAIKYIKKRRKVIHPNKIQISALRRFKNFIKK